MNCTKVLHAFGGHMMPQQSALLCLSQNQPLYHLLGVSSLKPVDLYTQLRDPQAARASLRPCSSPSSPECSDSRSCVRRDSNSHKKKRVVFADSRGLPLTTVRLFFPEPPSPTGALPTEPSPVRPQAPGPSPGPRYSLRLAFPQPTLDLKTFYSRLQETWVQLESCSATERSLRGTVRVCSFGFEKAVHVRVTFDSWKSHADIPCSYLQQQLLRNGASDTELFAFDVALPQNLDPKERVEFRVSYRPGRGGALLWDSNKGQNYRLRVEHEGSGASPAPASPRHALACTRQPPPSWLRCGYPGLKNHSDLSPYTPEMFSYQRWGRLENHAPFC